MNHRDTEIRRVFAVLLCLVAVAARPADNGPRVYNQGVTAYRSNDFTQAAQGFEQAISSPDRVLQELAFYNLGNACFRLGAAQPPQAQQSWQRALQSYQSALALDPNDADAKFNREFVKKKLEELARQQQQNQSDKNQQKDQQKDQQKNDQQQKDQQQQKEQPQPSKEQQAKQPPPPPKPDQKSSTPHQDQPPKSPSPPPGRTNNLEQAQAAALLDSLREEERNWNFFPEVQMKDLKDGGPPAKDW